MTATPPREVPAWVNQQFTEFIDRHERMQQVLHMSKTGISMLRAIPQALTVLAQAKEVDDVKHKERLEKAHRERELAQREVDHDFPMLHEQTTIAMWSSLEAMVRSFVAQWLQHTPSAWQVEAVGKLRVKLSDYESLDGLEKALWVVDLLDQEISGPLRNGVNRFEALLTPFGLGGPVDADVQRTLFELSQVRHVLVHRTRVVDRKLIEACPWLHLERGDHMKVSHAMVYEYGAALGQYTLELIQRTRVALGMSRYLGPEIEHIRERLDMGE
jgi:hypothetical protein